MPDNTLTIQNFKFGLDTRRSELTSQIGTLEVCQDAHITNGAEVEKREAFGNFISGNVYGAATGSTVLFVCNGSLSSDAVGISLFGVPTFGLTTNANGLVVFGSAAASVTNGRTGGPYYFSTGKMRRMAVTYVQCIRAAGVKDMTAVICACNFNGASVAAVTFNTDAMVYLYINGTVVASTPNFTQISCLLPFKSKVYAYCKDTVYFSDALDATNWATGLSGYFKILSPYGATDVNGALVPYQGNLAVISRERIQIWNAAGDPTQSALIQTLENTGTLATFSCQSMGDWDVLYLFDSGIRSLRVRDASNNAYVLDLGSPIDSLLQAIIPTLTAAQLTMICSGVVTSSSRYMIYVPDATSNGGTIYVLSYFPQAKITAWSTYTPTTFIAGVQSVFTPINFVNYKGLLCLRSAAQGGTRASDTLTLNAPFAIYQNESVTINGIQFIFQISPSTLYVLPNGPVYVDISNASPAACMCRLYNAFVRFSYTGYMPNVIAVPSAATWDENNLAWLSILFLAIVPGITGNSIAVSTASQNFTWGTANMTGGVNPLDRLIGFGDASGLSATNNFDSTQAIVTTPWLDAKNAALVKHAQSIDLAVSGAFAVQAGAASQDGSNNLTGVYNSGSLTNPDVKVDSTFPYGRVPYEARGTHFQFKATSAAVNTSAKLSSIILKYNEGEML